MNQDHLQEFNFVSSTFFQETKPCLLDKLDQEEEGTRNV